MALSDAWDPRSYELVWRYGDGRQLSHQIGTARKIARAILDWNAAEEQRAERSGPSAGRSEAAMPPRDAGPLDEAAAVRDARSRFDLIQERDSDLAGSGEPPLAPEVVRAAQAVVAACDAIAQASDPQPPDPFDLAVGFLNLGDAWRRLGLRFVEAARLQDLWRTARAREARGIDKQRAKQLWLEERARKPAATLTQIHRKVAAEIDCKPETIARWYRKERWGASTE